MSNFIQRCTKNQFCIFYGVPLGVCKIVGRYFFLILNHKLINFISLDLTQLSDMNMNIQQYKYCIITVIAYEYNIVRQ